MPESTVNWLWIGNRPAIDPTPNTNVTATQLEAAGMNGYTVTGPARIAPVAVTGTTTNTAQGAVFTAPFNAVGGFTSRFSFDSPSTSGPVSNLTIQTTFRGNVTITLPDGSTTTQVATIVQMSNGDIFLRPNANFLPAGDGITALRSITTDTATPFPNNTVLNSVISFNPDIFDIEIPCFAAGTMITTPTGERAVETLAPGDLVLTLDHGAQSVRWIGRRHLPGSALVAQPHLAPVRIAAGALGLDLPVRDMKVSPQHRVMVRSRIAERMFETEEVLVAAKHLVGLPGITQEPAAAGVTYVHFLCDRHEVVFAEGARVESLYAGPMALRALGPAAEEILAIFPELREFGGTGLHPVRPLVRGRQGRHLAERHVRNAVALQSAA
ncbi:MAG TPA: Hint domain-containing protein [Paracoccaceae bacterium]|nr:Hint domain-containing protein [Paracoccaceae bacterium]